MIHNESAPVDLRRHGGEIELLQLWLNLPSRPKESPPNYVGLEASNIRTVATDADRVRVRVVAGMFGETVGPIRSLTNATVLAIDLRVDGNVTLPAPAGNSVFLYSVEGTISIGGVGIEPYTRVEFDHAGDQITLAATSEAHVIYAHAPQIKEPVMASGPFVMSSYEEVVQAVRDFQAGRYD